MTGINGWLAGWRKYLWSRDTVRPRQANVPRKTLKKQNDLSSDRFKIDETILCDSS